MSYRSHLLPASAKAGPERVLLSSDMGQPDGLTPPAALLDFSHQLYEEGISVQELRTMLVQTPKELLS